MKQPGSQFESNDRFVHQAMQSRVETSAAHVLRFR